MALRYWYEIEVRHDGLGKYRHIRGTDRRVVEQMAQAQQQQWNDAWEKRLETERKREEAVRESQRQRTRAESERALRAQAKLEATLQRKSAAERKEAERQAELERRAAAKQAEIERKASRQQEAEQLTVDAQAQLESFASVLSHTLSVDDTIQWERLKSREAFPEPPPTPEPPPRPQARELPSEPDYPPPPSEPAYGAIPLPPEPLPWGEPPNPDNPKYQPNLWWLIRMISPLRQAEIKRAQERLRADQLSSEKRRDHARKESARRIKAWQEKKAATEIENAKMRKQWQSDVEQAQEKNSRLKDLWQERVAYLRTENALTRERWHEAVANAEAEFFKRRAEWETRKSIFESAQKADNEAIDQRRVDYLAREPEAVRSYCDMVLANSVYPAGFSQEYDIEYQADTRILIVEYALPTPEIIPTLKSVQYQATKDNFKETHITPKEQAYRYDELLYQVALRTLHELFEADVADAVDAVVFNGLVTARDKSRGHDVTACVLSLQARKEEFLHINLAQVEPRACFKLLKGVGAASLAGLAPVAPILQIDKSDRRFIESYAVADRINSGDNLAVMDWEDFEHLIRELFEKEFCSNGGEVRVTQASRDGGVDAVVFDPDPIRGGKIVIQAKRYTNAVGVSAVRDLYGTMMNEGAMKGILVTTANYGPDAYEFIRGKPLTLLNGANLLYLLERHGHQARIDLIEAKAQTTYPGSDGP